MIGSTPTSGTSASIMPSMSPRGSSASLNPTSSIRCISPNLAYDKPASCQQKVVSSNASGEAVAAQEAKLDEGKLTAVLVPVGCIGIWEKALQPGRYYAIEAAYKITMMSTRVQTWEFKGGYIRRYIDLSLDQAGNLK